MLPLLRYFGDKPRRRTPGWHHVTTPTSYYGRLTGTEAWTDPVSLPAGTTIGGAFVGTNVPVVVNAATLTLTAALHAGKIVNLVGTTAQAGVAISPPAATGTGNLYRIFFGASVTSNTTTIDFKPNTGDIAYGWCYQNKQGTGFVVYSTVANTNLVTADGSTRGGIIGDLLEFQDMATNLWRIIFWQNGSGTVATPFSNH